MTESKPEKNMQRCLNELGVALTIAWIPGLLKARHGEIDLKTKTLFIYDESEGEAWATFQHEVYEYTFKQVLSPYRTLINSLIEVCEKECYMRKEDFLEFLPKLQQAIDRNRGDEKH
jgi:hypothetical protein